MITPLNHQLDEIFVLQKVRAKQLIIRSSFHFHFASSVYLLFFFILLFFFFNDNRFRYLEKQHRIHRVFQATRVPQGRRHIPNLGTARYR